MIITEGWIARAEAAGACGEPLAWLRERPRSVDESCREHPDWALWACRLDGWAEVLGAERLDACAEREPWDALEYAAALLTPTRLDVCAERAPCSALEYAAALLTPTRLDACAEQEPWSALRYATALLTPERLAWCRREEAR